MKAIDHIHFVPKQDKSIISINISKNTQAMQN
jgi:hypothetical protein